MMENVSHDRVKTLLKDTITLLCKNGIEYRKKFSIEALIGITVDDDKVVLMSINELVRCSDNDRCEDEGSSVDSDNSSLHNESRHNKRKRRRSKTKRSGLYEPSDGSDNIVDAKKLRDDCEPYVVIKSEGADLDTEEDWSYHTADTQHHVVETSHDGTPYLITKSATKDKTSAWLQSDNRGDPGGVVGGSSSANQDQYQMTFNKVGEGSEDRDGQTESEDSGGRTANSNSAAKNGNSVTASPAGEETRQHRQTTYKQWSQHDMASAISAVLSQAMTVGAASRYYCVPNSTLKRKVKNAAQDYWEGGSTGHPAGPSISDDADWLPGGRRVPPYKLSLRGLQRRSSGRGRGGYSVLRQRLMMEDARERIAPTVGLSSLEEQNQGNFDDLGNTAAHNNNAFEMMDSFLEDQRHEDLSTSQTLIDNHNHNASNVGDIIADVSIKTEIDYD